ncbi:MAG TPA: ABC transporter permease subunit [Myxococcota bacterium]|jgi:iron(III) transport system permease protein|nr:ABC transporter permease subunit [Myxococcota bacterium]
MGAHTLEPARWWRRRQEPLVLAVVALLVAAAVLVPLVSLAAGVFARDGAAAFAVLGSPRVRTLFARSLALAAAATVLALAAGLPLGLWLGRATFRGRRVVLLVHAFPLFLPPFLVALGWFHLLGRTGARVLLFGPAGVGAVLGFAFAPLVTALVALAVEAVDPALVDAARAVARPARVATHVLLPLAWPAAALGGLVVFVLAFSELGVPLFLGVTVYPAEVFVRLAAFGNLAEATALCVPLVAVGWLVLVLERALGARPLAALGLRSGLRAPPPPAAAPRGRRLARAAALSLALAPALLPLAGLAWRAAAGHAFAHLGGRLGDSVATSLAAGAAGATAITALALVLGHAVVRRRRVAAVADALAVLGFVVPATVLALGLVAAWNRPATRLVYGSLAILVLGFVARYAVVGVRTFAVAVAQASPHLEEAAAAHGGSYLQRLARIVVPLHARGAVAAWLLAFLFCLRDVETAILYYPPGRDPLPVRIFALEANGGDALVAGLSLVQVALTAAALAAVAALLLVRRRHPA